MSAHDGGLPWTLNITRIAKTAILPIEAEENQPPLQILTTFYNREISCLIMWYKKSTASDHQTLE